MHDQLQKALAKNKSSDMAKSKKKSTGERPQQPIQPIGGESSEETPGQSSEETPGQSNECVTVHSDNNTTEQSDLPNIVMREDGVCFYFSFFVYTYCYKSLSIFLHRNSLYSMRF